MGKYIRKLEGVSPDRGTCLQLYIEKLQLIAALNPQSQAWLLYYLKSWFVDTTQTPEGVAAKLAEHADVDPAAVYFLKFFIGEQRCRAEAWVKECERKRYNAMRRSERNKPIIGVDTGDVGVDDEMA